MAHQNHLTTSTSADDVAAPRNARYGLILFAVYSSLYLAFMLLNAFMPQVMETIVFAGINLAVVYGLGLIATAFILALVYVWLCRANAEPGARA